MYYDAESQDWVYTDEELEAALAETDEPDEEESDPEPQPATVFTPHSRFAARTNPFTLEAARMKAELPQAEAELSKLNSTSDPGKRMEAATRVGQLRKGIEEAEMRAPLYGLDDDALIGTLEDAEIAAEETTDRLKTVPEKSVRAQRARREQEQAIGQVALVKAEQRCRKQLLANEYGQAEQQKRDLRNAWALERANRAKDLEEQRRELLSKPRSIDGTLALANVKAQIEHLRSADPDPEWAKRWKRERASE